MTAIEDTKYSQTIEKNSFECVDHGISSWDWRKEIYCSSMGKFYDALKPFMNKENQRYYVFRGISDTAYTLIPSIMHGNNIRAIKSTLIKNRQIHFDVGNNNDFLEDSWGSGWELIEAEVLILSHYYDECNQIGIKLPDISEFKKIRMEEVIDLNDFLGLESHSSFYWLPEQMVELAALAQHYGLPTRLMDWTFNVGMAAWFAAGKDNGKDCAIWAVNAKLLQGFKKYQREIYREKIDKYISSGALDSTKVTNATFVLNVTDNPLRFPWKSKELIYESCEDVLPLDFYVPPYHNNHNLQAQQGILSIWRQNLIKGLVNLNGGSQDFHKDLSHEALIKISKCLSPVPRNIPLNDLLIDYLGKHKSEFSEYIKTLNFNPKRVEQRAVLYKIVIAESLKQEVMDFLNLLGFNYIKTFPSNEKVAENLRNQWKLN